MCTDRTHSTQSQPLQLKVSEQVVLPAEQNWFSSVKQQQKQLDDSGVLPICLLECPGEAIFKVEDKQLQARSMREDKLQAK